MFDELSPPYSTIVADPPWQYGQPFPQAEENAADAGHLPYSSMSLDEIKALPVGDLTVDGRCYLWVTNRYLRHGWDVLESWGFETGGRVLVWCKPKRATMRVTTEFVLMGKRGKPPTLPWHGTTWFDWPRQPNHSKKPDGFMDLVEAWSPGPYLELFSRAPRFGWDSWGYGYESTSGSGRKADNAIRQAT